MSLAEAEANSPPVAPHRTPWLLMVVLYLSGLIASVQFAKVALTLEALQLAYPGAPVAFVVSAVAVMGVLFGVLAGGITASIGPRRAILWALAISAIAGGAQAVLPGFNLLMALRFVEGAGHLILVVAVPTLMATLASDRDRPVIMGIWATFFGVGFTIAALLVGDAGPALIFAIHAAIAALLLATLWLMLPKGLVIERRPLPRLADHIAIYRTPRLFAPALGHGLYAMLFLALVTFLPDALDAAWLSPILPIAGLAGSMLAGALAQHILPGTLVWGGFLAMVACFVATALAGPWAPSVAIFAMGVSGIVAGAGFAAVPWLNDSAPDRALANGALAQLGNVGTFAGTPILAALGLAAALPMAIVGGLIGAALTWLAYRAAARALVR